MFNLKSDIQEKLAKSLTAETIDLLPFLPYLLQDLWELGSSPSDIVALIQKHILISENTTILDLACGKGAVSIRAAQVLKTKVKGVDIIPDFIKYAERKAIEHGVDLFCRFAIEDINETIKVPQNFDCVIFGAVGNVLGTPQETMMKLKNVIKPKGYIVIDDAYLKSEGVTDIKYQNYDYLTYDQWLKIFEEAGLTIVDGITSNDDDSKNDFNTRLIASRADGLIKQYPLQKKLFEEYIQSQKNECEDLENSLVGITWLLQGR
jgi:SAM-dependent methyltransferase